MPRPKVKLEAALTGPSKVGVETLKASISLAAGLVCQTVGMFTEKGLGTNWIAVLWTLAPIFKTVYDKALAINWASFTPELRDLQIRELSEVTRTAISSADCVSQELTDMLVGSVDWFEQTISLGDKQFKSGKELLAQWQDYLAAQ